MNLLLASCLLVVWLGGTSASGTFELKLNRRVVQKSSKSAFGHGRQQNVTVWSKFHNTLYTTNVSIGTPPQIFEVRVDTGSEYLWVARRGCQCDGKCEAKFCQNNNQTYDYDFSNTSKATGFEFDVTYRTGNVSGEFINDTFALGDGTDPNAFKFPDPIMFGAASDITYDDMGVLGLCYMEEGDRGTSVLQEMFDKTLVQRPIFSIFYKDCHEKECEDGGRIFFGNQDEENCDTAIKWLKREPRDSNHWGFNVSEFSINGNVYATNFTGVTDTSTSFILVNKEIMDKIVKDTNAIEKDGPIPYIKNCTDFKLEVNLKMKGENYTMASDKLIQTSDDDPQGCYLNIMVDDRIGDKIIFGDPWVRSYCQVYDWAAKQVGFAKQKPLPPRPSTTSPAPGQSTPSSSPGQSTPSTAPGQSTAPQSDDDYYKEYYQDDGYPGHAVSQNVFLVLFGFVLFR